MKRLLIPLIILLALALLIGCGKETTTPTAPAAPSAPSAPATTPATKPATTPATTPATPAPAATPAPKAPSPKHGGTLKFISYTADTAIGGWPADTGLQGSLAYEGLIQQQASGEFTPCLATSWDIAPDRTSVTFHLRKGVKFTDGTDFNAQAVKFNYEAQMANKKAPYWASVEVLDDYTVKVNVTKWRTTTLMQFGDSSTSGIASPTAFQKNGIEWMREHPVGTGAYMFSKFTRDVATEFVRNPNYWQPEKPYVDAFHNIIITDEVTQKAAMQAGEGDATLCEIGKSTIDYKNMGLTVDSAIQVVFCLVPDTANPDSPWSNIKVRMAADYAINKEAIAAGMGYGLWQAPYQIPPRGNAVWNPNFNLGRKYDLAKAKQLMAEAGYPTGFKTTIIPFPGATSRDVTLAVQDALSKIGIEAESQFVDFGKYFQINQEGWHNALIFHPVPAYAIYIETINSLFDPDNSLFFKISWERTPEFRDALIKANAVALQDVALTRAVTDIMSRDAMVITVYEGGKSYAYQPYVKDPGFLTRGFANSWNTENVWLDK